MDVVILHLEWFQSWLRAINSNYLYDARTRTAEMFNIARPVTTIVSLIHERLCVLNLVFEPLPVEVKYRLTV